jgi:hypothetical protein
MVWKVSVVFTAIRRVAFGDTGGGVGGGGGDGGVVGTGGPLLPETAVTFVVHWLPEH